MVVLVVVEPRSNQEAAVGEEEPCSGLLEAEVGEGEPHFGLLGTAVVE